MIADQIFSREDFADRAWTNQIEQCAGQNPKTAIQVRMKTVRRSVGHAPLPLAVAAVAPLVCESVSSDGLSFAARKKRGGQLVWAPQVPLWEQQ